MDALASCYQEPSLSSALNMCECVSAACPQHGVVLLATKFVIGYYINICVWGSFMSSRTTAAGPDERERPQERKSGPGASCAHVPATGVVGSSGAVLAEQELPRLARCAHRPPRKFLIRNCPRPRPPGPARRGAGKGAGLRLFNSPVLSVLSINISVISVNHTRNADR